MDDPSVDAPAGPDAGGGFTGFVTSLRGAIAAVATLVIAISGLITALKATGVLNGDAAPISAGPKDEPGPFRSIRRPNGRVYFDAGAMYVTASTPGQRCCI
jgi:hypothetical protein